MSNNQEKSKRYDSIIEEWQNTTFKLCLAIIIIAFFVEMIFMIGLYANGTISTSIHRYLLLFLLRPSVVNLLTLAICRYVYYRPGVSVAVKDRIPILLVTVIMANLVVTHFVFPAVYTILMVPLYISIIYGNLEITNFTFRMLHVAYALVLVMIHVLPTTSTMPESFWFNAILGYVFLVFSYIIVRNIVRAENKKEQLVLAQRQENSMLMEAVLYDGLTGVYNHTGLYRILEKYTEQYRDGDSLYFAIIDLDFFKKINDEFGHEVGNVVLERMGELLREISGEHTDVARYGGEEFAVCFRGVELDTAVQELRDLHDKFCATHYEKINHNVTFSAGIARYSNRQSVSDLIDAADQVLYEAKRTGRNRIVLEGGVIVA